MPVVYIHNIVTVVQTHSPACKNVEYGERKKERKKEKREREREREREKEREKIFFKV